MSVKGNSTNNQPAGGNFNKKKPKIESTFKRRMRIVGTKNRTGWFWRGIPCECRVLLCEVVDTNQYSYWANPFIGQTRQIIEVKEPTNDNVFYVDNYDGSGLIMLTHGMGLTGTFWRGIVKPKIIDEITDKTQWQQFDIVKYYEVEKAIKSHFKQ